MPSTTTDTHSPADFRRVLEVETPEHVVVDYEIAGLGSRALAALLDLGIVVAMFIAVIIGMSFAQRVAPVAANVVIVVAGFALIWGYFAFFEGFRHGQTPGKRIVGIRVMRETGHPVTFRDAAARNLLRIIDFLPPPYLLGAVLVLFHPRGKRLGDIVAGTVVVRDRPAEMQLQDLEAAPERQLTLGAPELTDAEYRVLREFNARYPALNPAMQARLASTVAGRLSQFPRGRAANDIEFLVQLFRTESARRRGQLGVASAALGERGSVIGERLMTSKRDRWRTFQRLADRAAVKGLDSFAASELPDFARRYREVAADLARARTYHAPQATVFHLERIVAAGHNALYRDERKTWALVFQYVARECPAAIIRARRYVLVAFLTFAIPAVLGYAMLRERPALAEQVLPAALLERADEGARMRSSGEGYAEAVAAERPLIAASIITNNVQVAVVCFASGILLGVGSLVALAFNGAMIGAASGHYANRELLGYLWTFVAGHGVLELFAIWVAGAAGLLLGRAIIAPGAYSRSDALVRNGRLAMALVGASVTLLLVAGSIEGFISTSRAPLGLKLTVSVTSVVLLLAYLAQGIRVTRSTGRDDVVVR